MSSRRCDCNPTFAPIGMASVNTQRFTGWFGTNPALGSGEAFGKHLADHFGFQENTCKYCGLFARRSGWHLMPGH